MDDALEWGLDPKDWGEVRREAHALLDDLLEFTRTQRERPAWRQMPEALEARFDAPLPEKGEGVAAACRDFREWVLPYPTGNAHPRFWGWVMGCGDAVGVMAEMAAAAMNCNVVGFDDSATRVEAQAVRWLSEMVHFRQGSGLLVSGASMANLVGLAVARSAKAGFDVREAGMAQSKGPLTVYVSNEVHFSAPRAAELLGFGAEAVRRIPVDARYRMDIGMLEQAIRRDRSEGRRPICVVGSAGTVNTGAIDDLSSMADIAQREGLWFHVDAAIGGWAALSPKLRPLVAGQERADSICLDLHKWLQVPYGTGCVLLRDASAHRAAFGYTAAYHSTVARGVSGHAARYSGMGPEQSRVFHALKVWMCLKAHGAEAYRNVVEQNVRQAQALAARVSREPKLELLAEPQLNIVCFRHRGNGDLNALNQEILFRLQESGAAVPSSTVLDGRFAIRVCITNHRTRTEDLTFLVDEVLRLGASVSGP
jgi:aromatic-L-amino-acid decarboxylase